MNSWYDSSINSNIFTKTYVNGFLDVSQNVSARGNLYVNGDVSLNSELYVNGKSTFINDISINGDVSLGQKLNVSGDVSFNSTARVDVCGNFYAQYPDNSIPISAIIGDNDNKANKDYVDDISLNLANEIIRAQSAEQTNADNISSNQLYIDVSLNLKADFEATDVSLNLKADIEATDVSLNLKADLTSPVLDGIPEAPTAASTTNTNQVATTAFVQLRIGEIVDGAPGALDTLNELANALGSDVSFSTTVTTLIGDVSTNLETEVIRAKSAEQTNADAISSNQLYIDASFNLKADLLSPTFGGAPRANTAASGNSSLQLANTEFVQSRIDEIIGDAPESFTTLSIIATALGNDVNFSTTVTTLIGDVSTNLETEVARAQSAEQANAGTISSNKSQTDTSMNLKADLVSPSFTGEPTSITFSGNDNSTKLATTAFVQTRISDIIGGAPDALDTLNELANALGSDVNFSTTITTLIGDISTNLNSEVTRATAKELDNYSTISSNKNATDSSLLLKANLAYTDASLNLKVGVNSPGFTGIPTAPTAENGNNTTQLATTEFVNTAVASDRIDLTQDISINNITIGIGLGDVSTNTVIGFQSLSNNIDGHSNVANGYQSLSSNTTGNSNVANGFQSLKSNVTGDYNVANGFQSLSNNEDGHSNVANGYQSLKSNVTGTQNTASGYQSLYDNGGSFNTANGYQSLKSNTTGYNNTANGNDALMNNIGGVSNTALGYQAGTNNTTSNYNTFVGSNSNLNSNGDTWEYSTALGYNAKITASNQIMLGRSNETVEVPGNLTVDGSLTVDGNVDVCGNFYAQYPDKSINVTALKNNNNLSDTTYNTFVITVSSSKYFVNGIQQDTLILYRGLKYSFDVTDNTTNSHPFYIQTTDNAGSYDSGNIYNDGVTYNGATTGFVEFTVPNDAPDMLYYICGSHSGMGGIINIQNYLNFDDNLLLSSTLDIAGATTLKSTLAVTGASTMNNTLTVANASTLNSTLAVTGATTMGSTMTVSGAVTLSSTLDVTGASTMNNTLKVNDTLTVSKASTLSSTLMVSNAATMGNTLKVNDTLTVSKASTLSSTLDVYNATTLNSTLDVTGKTILHNDVSMNGHVDISGDLIINGNLSVYQYDDVKTINTTVNEYTSIVTEDISLNGKLSVSGDASFNGDLYVTNAATLSSTLSVSKAATLSSTLKVSGASTMDSTLTVAGASTLSSTLAVSKAATLSSTLNVNGASTMDNTLTVSNASTLSSTLAVSKAATLSSTLKVGGASTMDSTLTVAGASTMGSTLTVAGVSTLNSTLAVSKAATLSSTLNVTGASTMNNTLTLVGASTLNSTLTVSKAATLSSTLNVIGASTMNGTLTVAGASTLSSTLTVSKSATLSSTLNVNGASTMNSTFTLAGASTLNSTLAVSKATTLSSTLNVIGASTMNNTLTVANATTLSSTLNVSKSVMFSSALTVTGKTTFENDVSLNGNLNMNGDVSLNSNLYVKDSIQIDKMTIANEPPGPDKWTQLGQAVIGESVDSNLGSVCALSNDGSTLASMSYTNYTARYFFIQLETPSVGLVASEIEIYDENGDNIALNKTPTILSSNANDRDHAFYANDGITDSGYAWTSAVSGERSWWGVDLEENKIIASIKFYGHYGAEYILGGSVYSRTAPFRIFLYEDADYPNGSFIDGTSGGPGPLNYFNYQLHSGDATDSSIINGNQQVFTFTNVSLPTLKLYRYSSSDSIWAQIGSIDGIAGQPIADKTVSLSNDGSIVALSSYNTSSTYTARYFFIQIEDRNEYYMNYAEIQIYDENGTNIALNKTSVQDTTTTQPANLGNDGDLTTFQRTKNEDTTARPWWGVDLEENTNIASIKIYGRINDGSVIMTEGGSDYNRIAPFHIFLYEDADYTGSFTAGGTGPLNYGNYQLHSGDATDSSTINGNQQVFTFNTFPIGNVRVFQYDNSNDTWPQLGQTIQNEIRHNGGITTSLTNYNDSTTVALSSYDTSSTYTARYFFLQLESTTESFLNLAEIEIYDENNNNLAYAVRDVTGSTIQTNTHHATNDVARSAVDGVLTNYQSTTTGAVRPWWGIDLGENKTIASIKIYGRLTYALTSSRIGPFRIFFYQDGEYPESSFKYGTDGGTGPLNYFNYQLHTDDATDATYINSQSIFTFNSFHPIRGNARMFQYSNTVPTWTQLGQTIEGKVDNATNVSLSNDGNTVSIGSYVPTTTARYFFIQLETTQISMNYSEIEIYDETGTNIAFNRFAIQSSNLSNNVFPASNAVNGINNKPLNADGDYNHTDDTSGLPEWWGVDLGSNKKISDIRIYSGNYPYSHNTTTGNYYTRTAPFRIFLYKDADYTVSFADGGTGPLNYDNYTLHTIDATTNETINGNQQVFTFNIAEYPHKTGNARVFTYDTTTTTWSQLGGDIDDDQAAINVLSGDGTIVAIGAPYNDGVNGTDSGHVRVYQRDSNKTTAVTDQTDASFGPVGWNRLGQDIDGYAAGDESGSSLSLSNDGFTVAIGAPKNDGTGTDSGHTRVYKYASATNVWTQKGLDIDGTASGDQFGSSVALSGDGTILVNGAPYTDINGSNSGSVRVHQYGPGLSGILNLGDIMVGYGIGGITNTLLGKNALLNNHNGTENTALGYYALYSNTTGYANTANGYQVLMSNTTGYDNTANGYQVLMANTTGDNNTAYGYKAGFENTTGSYNTFLGANTNISSTNATLSKSTAVGYNAKITDSNQIVLGTSDTNVYVPYRMGIGTNNPTNGLLHISGNVAFSGSARKYINSQIVGYSTGNVSNEPVSIYATNIMVANAFYSVSDRRIKNNIVDVPDNLALQQVRDIPCRYYEYIDKISKSSEKVIGFIAQEVNEVLPMAVNTGTDYIPNEYCVLEGVSWEEIANTNGNVTYKMSSDLTDVSGVNYKFYVSNDLSDNEIEKQIIGNSDDTFTFDVSYQNVFCFGMEVDDFHSIDKDQIFALHHSAIQEIDRLQLEEKEKTTALETKVTELETKNAELQTQLNSIMTILNNNNLS